MLLEIPPGTLRRKITIPATAVYFSAPGIRYKKSYEKVLKFQKIPKLLVIHTVHMTDEIEDLVGVADLVLRLTAAAKIHQKQVSAPMIKCKKTPRKKCSFVAEEAKKR